MTWASLALRKGKYWFIAWTPMMKNNYFSLERCLIGGAEYRYRIMLESDITRVAQVAVGKDEEEIKAHWDYISVKLLPVMKQMQYEEKTDFALKAVDKLCEIEQTTSQENNSEPPPPPPSSTL